MASLSDSRIIEGLKHNEKAEKYLKKSLFKWSADYASAADEYNKAGVSFLNAQAFEESKIAYNKAADCYIKSHAASSAGRCYEQIAAIHKELGEWQGCYDMTCKAAEIFYQEGSARTALMTYLKGAKMIERSTSAENGAELYKKAIDVASSEDDHREVAELNAKVAAIYIRLNRYFDATHYLRKQLDEVLKEGNTYEIGRVTLNLVVVNLTRDDPLSAENALNQACSNIDFAGSTGCATCLKLIRTYEEDEDSDNLHKFTTTDSHINNLDNDYLILVRQLKTAFDTNRTVKKEIRERGNAPTDSSDGPRNDFELDRNPNLQGYATTRRSMERDIEENNFNRIKLAEQLQKRLSLHQSDHISDTDNQITPTRRKPSDGPSSSTKSDNSHSSANKQSVPHVTSPSSPAKDRSSLKYVSPSTSLKASPAATSPDSNVFKYPTTNTTQNTQNLGQEDKVSRSSSYRSNRDIVGSPSNEEVPLKEISSFHAASFKKVSRASLSRHSSKSPNASPPYKNNQSLTSPNKCVTPEDNLDENHGGGDSRSSERRRRRRKESLTNEGEHVIEYEEVVGTTSLEKVSKPDFDGANDLVRGNKSPVKVNSPRKTPDHKVHYSSLVNPNADLIIQEIPTDENPKGGPNKNSPAHQSSQPSLPREESEYDLR